MCPTLDQTLCADVELTVFCGCFCDDDDGGGDGQRCSGCDDHESDGFCVG